MADGAVLGESRARVGTRGEAVADLCTTAGVEHVVIDRTCSLDQLLRDLRTGEVYHALTGALGR